MQDQKAVWKQETAALKDSLVEARKEMASAQVDSDQVLQSSRSASSDFKNNNGSTLADSRKESNAAMLEAGNSLKNSQRDYKKKSQAIAKELTASMKEVRKTLKNNQKSQRRNAKNSHREVLAALKTNKDKRISELKKQSIKQRLQNKKTARSSIKQNKNQARIKKVEKRQAFVTQSKSKVRNIQRAKKRTTQQRKTQKKAQSKPIKKRVARSKTKIKSTQDSSITKSYQDEKNQTILNSPEVLDDEFNKTFGETGLKKDEKAGEEAPEQNIVTESVTDPVVASLPNTEEETAQEKLSQFSKNISDLKSRIKISKQNPQALLEKLGDAYLEAQHFMDSIETDEERQGLLSLSFDRDLYLGSYEQAAWAYKLALNFNKKNGPIHLKIGKIYDEMGDGINALMYAKLAQKLFRKNHNSKELQKTQSLIERLNAKYEPESEKKTVHKG